MEGNTEQLSFSQWIDGFLKGTDEIECEISSLKRLYPELDDDYFERHPEVRLERKKNHKPSIRPYITRRDLNNDEKTPFENKPVPALEIGLKVDF